MLCSMASSAWRRASLTAEITRSCSISTSSGSTASGLMLMAVTTFLPLTVAVTTPPPTVAVNSLASTSSWARFMASCISCWRWAPVGRMLPLENPRRAL